MRVVFDTNVLVSALAISGGRADLALQRIIDRGDTLLISQAIIDELMGALARKFARDAESIARLALFLDDLAEFVRPRRRIRALADDADNRILECALEGHADAVVTGDRAMVALRTFRGVRILSLSEYLQSA